MQSKFLAGGGIDMGEVPNSMNRIEDPGPEEIGPEICNHCAGSGEGKSMPVCPVCGGSGETQ